MFVIFLHMIKTYVNPRFGFYYVLFDTRNAFLLVDFYIKSE